MRLETIYINESKGFRRIRISEMLNFDNNNVYHNKIGNSFCITPFRNLGRKTFESLYVFAKKFLTYLNQSTNQ